eukprot:149003-Prorocentrum_minimum.AAC.1
MCRSRRFPRDRLVGSKESGASVSFGGEEVKLGIPGGMDADQLAIAAGCPLRRGGPSRLHNIF